jgi:tetratricopeptide (TPR) repeat protein
MGLRLKVLIVLLASSCVAIAQLRAPNPQVGPSTSAGARAGANLVVEVLSEDHSFLNVQALVRIRGAQDGFGDQWQTTGTGSEASFSSLTDGPYEVEVSALGFKTSVARVDVFGFGSQTVQVVLKKDLNAEEYEAPPANVSRKARKWSERGMLALQMGKLKDAEKNFRRAVNEAPDDAHVNYLLGAVLLKEKDLEPAAQSWQRAIELDARNAPALMGLAGLRFEQKDYLGAADLLQRAIAVNSNRWRAHWLLANTRLMQGQYEQALTEAQLAVNLSQNSAPDATLVLGEALGELGRYHEAAMVLRRLLEQAPGSPDAPAVVRMIVALESSGPATPITEPVALSVSSVSLPPSLPTMSPGWMPPGVDDLPPPVASGVTCSVERILTGAGEKVQQLADDLARFSATETQMHETLDAFGKPLTQDTRKSEYFAELAQPRPGWLQLSEYRRNRSGEGAFTDGVQAQGLLGLAFVFHPALQENYQLECEGLGEWKGQTAWLVHFRQRPDHPRRLQGFKVGGENYEVALKGRAWIAAASFQLLHIEADLLEPLREAHLLYEHEVSDYGPIMFKAKKTELWLPEDTQVYMDYRGHRLRLTDHFENFVLFSTDSQQTDKLPKRKQ